MKRRLVDLQVVVIFFLVLISLVSVYLKVHDLGEFSDNEAFLTTFDAFRFARYSLQLQDNTYGKIDYLADVPDFGINQYPPPFLSLLAVWISTLLGIEIRYLFVFMPVICSVLFIIPFYLWLKSLNNDYAVIGGVALSVFNLNYFIRTQAGYFDTDCLMLFFVFSILLFLTKSVIEKGDNQKSYLFIVIAGLFVIIFRWWYDHLFFALIFSLSLLLGLVVWKHGIKDILLKLLLFVSFCSPVELFYYVLKSPFLKDYIYGNIAGISEYKSPLNIYASIAELRPVSLDGFISHTTDNPYTFYLSIGFFIFFFLKNIRYMIVSLPFIVIGFSAFYTGYRYLIYASPFLGIGLGYSVYTFVKYIKKRFSINDGVVYIAGLVIVLFLAFPGQRLLHEKKHIFEQRHAYDLAKIKELTEPNAYIWSWWDMGNPIQYYSGRATYMDNTYFSPVKTYIILNSLTTNDEDITYRSIAFVTNQGGKEYGNLMNDLSQLNNAIISYPYDPQRSVYLYLYDRVIATPILRGNALPKEDAIMLTKRMPQHIFSYEVKEDMTADCGDMIVDIKNESVKLVDKNVERAYSKIAFYNKQSKTRKEIPLNNKSQSAIYLIFSKIGKLHQIIAHEDFEQTILFRMLVASEDNFRHFELVYEDYPYMVLYKVR